MIHTILTVTTQHVGSLDATRAVELVANLLWVEARRLGVPTTHVHVSMRINVADGGGDASIDTDAIDDARWEQSFIPDGRTAHQIKTGTSFKPWQQSDISDELFGKRIPPSKDALGASVQDSNPCPPATSLAGRPHQRPTRPRTDSINVVGSKPIPCLKTIST
jgi:hypothetical protein